jgi:hypothetical protein
MRQSKSRVQVAEVRARSTRPLGEVTRGKTAPNRLRGVDAFLLRYADAHIRRTEGDWADAWTVDLGYGEEPTTTLEMARALRRINPQARVLGVEIDAARVEAAQGAGDALTHFRLGGFNLPLQRDANGQPERARLIRAFNVLRQYDEASVLPAWSRMMQSLLPDGLLIEGTSDPLGRLWVANVLRRQRPAAASGAGAQPTEAGVLEALVFGTNFRTPFEPAAFKAVLPKNLIHRVEPGEAIHHLFGLWEQAARLQVAHRELGMRQWFVAAAESLADYAEPSGWRVDIRRKWLRDGILILSPPEAEQTRVPLPRSR